MSADNSAGSGTGSGAGNSGDEAGASAAAAGSRLVRRRRTVLVTAAVAVVLSVGGLLGSSWVQSPSQAAADTRPPKASVITASVVKQVLRSTVVLRGTFSDGRTVSAAPTSVAATRVTSQPAQLMVTGVYAKVGQNVGAAQVLVEYSGRPVFALKGALPAYRDLTFGEQGKDVTQLQAALRSSGHPTGSDAKGAFGAGTEHAVERLYAAMGYQVPVSTGEAAQPGDGAADGKDGAAATGTPAPPAAPVTHAMVPASEVVFIPSLPARVVSVPVRVGDPVKGSVVTLARGGMTLTGQLDPSQAGLVAAGMKAQVLAEATGAEADGTVDGVGAPVAPDSGGKDGDDAGAPAPSDGAAYLPLAISPAKAWDAKFAGQDVRITITAAATDKAVLAVPPAGGDLGRRRRQDHRDGRRPLRSAARRADQGGCLGGRHGRGDAAGRRRARRGREGRGRPVRPLRRRARGAATQDGPRADPSPPQTSAAASPGPGTETEAGTGGERAGLVLELVGAAKSPRRCAAGARAAPGGPRRAVGRLRRGGRPLGFRQVHAAQPAGPARPPHRGQLPARRLDVGGSASGTGPRCAAAGSASSSSPSTCCPTAPRWRTSRSRSSTPGAARRPAAPRRRAAPGRAWAPASRAADHAVGRRAPAGRDRPGPGQPAVLLLCDEPTGNLDSANAAWSWTCSTSSTPTG